MKRAFGATLILLFVSSGNVSLLGQQAIKKSRILSEEEARELLTKALEPGGAPKLPGYSLEKTSTIPEGTPDYYSFQALWDNPQGVAVIGNYAVDARTGDVWSGTVCRALSSRPLRVLQGVIRKRIGLADQLYQQIKRPGPMCGPGEKPLK